jgi:hypothetical protein
MYRRELKLSKFEAVKYALDILDPVRVGTTTLSVSLHPQTLTQYDYIREAMMERGITSGFVHSPEEFHSNFRGLGRLKNDLTVFTVTR